jgi:hypothetical protein
MVPAIWTRSKREYRLDKLIDISLPEYPKDWSPITGWTSDPNQEDSKADYSQPHANILQLVSIHEDI